VVGFAAEIEGQGSDGGESARAAFAAAPAAEEWNVIGEFSRSEASAAKGRNTAVRAD